MNRLLVRDIFLGLLAGAVLGAIAAVNFVIYAGFERGYETSLPEVFRRNPIAGVITVMILLGGPLLGVWTALRIRRRKAGGPPEPAGK